MTRAARELGLAVSTVSEHLKLLREAYGNPLFLPSEKGLAPSIFAEELFPAVSDALGACAKALPHEGALRTAVVISLSDDFEIVLGRKLTDAFREQLPEATPILRQTNALLAERVLLSRATHFTITGEWADEEKLMDLVLDAGANDLTVEDGVAEVWADPENFETLVKLFEEKGIPTEEAEVIRKPEMVTEVTDVSIARQVMRLVERMEELDDVQQVTANYEISDAIADQLEEE